jgi:hypothetical protein
MSLNAGVTLQNQKYVIQNLLHQSDFGITYQAEHAYLEQPVMLQSLNDSLRQRSDFAQIRQQFFAKVRSIDQGPGKARVLDCFEEDGMPFVVFELLPGQTPPQLQDWFPLLPETLNPFHLSEQDSLLVSDSTNSTAVAAPDISSVVAIAETQPPILPTAQPELEAVPNRMTATAVVQRPLPVIEPPRRVRGWLPIALILMSMSGGLLGAGVGLALRLSPSKPAQETATKLPHRLFSREQTFPSESEWPISETPQFFPSDPVPVEQPVYRVSPTIETYVQPKIHPVPSQAPVQMPAATELPKTAEPKPQTQPNTVDPAALGLPDVTITNSPAALSPVVPAVPSDPAPAPAAAPEPAPPSPEPPRAEATPAAPMPIKELPVLKQ